MQFYSDNTATMCPEVLEAIAQANLGHAAAYGQDPWTHRLDAVFGHFFAAPVRAFAVPTGTAANALALAAVSPPYGAIFAHEQSHVIRDECGAPTFYSGGAQLVELRGPQGKLTPAIVAAALNANPASIHTVQASAVSLAQATEAGTVYRPDEIAALAEFVHGRGLKLHLDGARLSNALVFLGCEPADLTWRAGVDVLSFGATKNGALAAEAVIFFDPTLAHDFELRRKRAGHLMSKSRYISAQLLAYLESGAWRRNASHANALAQQVAAHARRWLMYPVESNALFLDIGATNRKRLRADGFGFFDWGPADSGHARLVVSWDQPAADVAALCAALDRL